MQLDTPFGPLVIMVDKVPDGRNYEIKCLIPDITFIYREPESGEDIECQAFYSKKGEKISICVQCECGFFLMANEYQTSMI